MERAQLWFSKRPIFSVFVVLIFMPETQHHAKTCREFAGVHFGIESSSTRSSADNRRCTVQSPIVIPPQDSASLTVLSI